MGDDDSQPPPANGASPIPRRSDPVPFNPETLDKTMISLELLEAMRTGGEGAVLDVIIEVNFEFPDGRDEARGRILTWLRRRLKSAANGGPAASPSPDAAQGRGDAPPPERLDEAKGEFSAQYVFAALTPATIRTLIADLRRKPRRSRKATPDGAASGPDRAQPKPESSSVYKVWLDHDLKHFTTVSIATVKADAARAAFGADGRGVVWAVADSGVDASHPHFARHGNLAHLPAAVKHRDFTGDAHASKRVREAAARRDLFGHGTHVAGIIAGEIGDETSPASEKRKSAARRPAPKETMKDAPAAAISRERDESDNVTTTATPLAKISGMAPCCKLLSLKVLDESGAGKASNLIAAIEYIQHLNSNGRNIRVHGVNISVGYSYKPEWFACGQSPLCVEIDRLVRSGVCVVVAAGNDGYGFVRSANDSGAAAGLDVTIADPGNAALAVTVGSTHREMPHTYGVSYFSSKGPTGDGRLKPDILAPGEKIISCMSAQMTDDALQKAKLSRAKVDAAVADARPGIALYREDSGTSMAAPHVSGVIAAFLSTRHEFIGRPEDVKQIFLSTATDLNRAVYFQGKGLVDLMRAIQSV